MVRWWLAVVLVCGGVMSRDIALAGSGWDYGGGEGRFGSPAAACKEMVGTDGYYIYSHVEKAPSGDYYCYSKPKDGEGKPDYIGLVSEVVKPESIEGEKQSESSSPAAVKPEKQQKAEIVKTRADVRTHLHHVFPQKFYSQFKAIGIDVDDYVMQLPIKKHIGKDGVHVKDDYNGKWEDYFNELKGTKEERKKKAEEYVVQLLNEMGIANFPIGSVNTGQVNTSGVK